MFRWFRRILNLAVALIMLAVLYILIFHPLPSQYSISTESLKNLAANLFSSAKIVETVTTAGHPQPPDPREHDQPGALAGAYLQPSPYARLQVEVDAVSGMEPDADALDAFASRLNDILQKPGGVSMDNSETFPATRQTYSKDDIAALSSQHRSIHTAGSTAGLYILAVNGSYSPAPQSLGLAFDASTIVLFPEQMKQAGNASIFLNTLERAVLLHEFGHLLGLVGAGTPMQTPRQDPQHPGHSNSTHSVMYWAVDDVSVISILRTAPPADFDANDLADLKAAGGNPR